MTDFTCFYIQAELANVTKNVFARVQIRVAGALWVIVVVDVVKGEKQNHTLHFLGFVGS